VTGAIKDGNPRGSTSPYFVYIVRCSDGTLYTGITSDVERRIREHNGRRASKYTQARVPVTLVFLERSGEKGDALRRESQIKGLSRRSKLRLSARYLSSLHPRS